MQSLHVHTGVKHFSSYSYVRLKTISCRNVCNTVHSSIWVTNTLCCTSLFTSGVDDLYDLKKELNKVSAKWYDIGIALRLDPDILTGIQDSNIGQPSSCLRSMLTEWLKQNYNVKKFGEPTWQWVVDAVGDPAGGGHMALARDIARRHKPRAMSGGYTITTQASITSNVARQ